MPYSYVEPCAARWVEIRLVRVLVGIRLHTCADCVDRENVCRTLCVFGKERLGKSLLPSLQPRKRVGTEVGGDVHVRADGRYQAAAEIGGKTNLFLSTML